MWIPNQQLRKWRSDSLEARIYAIAEAEAHANGLTDGEAAGEAMEAVYRVMGWLASGTLAGAKDLIKEEFGVETSQAALSGFWRRFKSSWLGERMRRSNSAAKELVNLLDRDKVEAATWDMISQAAFEMLTSPEPDPSALVKVGKLILQGQKQAIDERKVALLEEKAKKLDELEAKAKSLSAEGGLSAETLEVIEKQLKLL